jgi:hypothetical protein
VNEFMDEELEGKQHEGDRRFRRYHLDVRLRLLTGPANSHKTIFARGSNISEGGMRVFVPADLILGELVTLELMLPYTEQKLVIRGVLRNRDGFSYGVEYAASTTAAERDQISRACKALALIQ